MILEDWERLIQHKAVVSLTLISLNEKKIYAKYIFSFRISLLALVLPIFAQTSFQVY